MQRVVWVCEDVLVPCGRGPGCGRGGERGREVRRLELRDTGGPVTGRGGRGWETAAGSADAVTVLESIRSLSAQ